MGVVKRVLKSQWQMTESGWFWTNITGWGHMQVTKRVGLNTGKHITALVDLSGLGLLYPCSL